MDELGPIGGGGSNPKPTGKTVEKTVNKTVSSNIYKRILSLIPLIALSLIVFSTNYYYFFNEEYKKIYELITYVSGFSLMSIVPYFYIVYRYNFCLYSKYAVWGILVYIVINISYFFAGLLDVEIGYYAQVFEAVSITSILGISIIYLIRKK